MGDKKKTHKLVRNIRHLVATLNGAQSVQDPISMAELNDANVLLNPKLDAVLHLLQQQQAQSPPPQPQVPTPELVTIAMTS